jgi:hypothetical protein
MVRPVDLQDNLSKAPLVSREQHLQQTDPQMAQRQVTRDLTQQHVLDHSRTRETEPHDRVELRHDDRERQRQGHDGDQRQPAPEEAPPAAAGEQAGADDPSRRIDLIA